MEAQRAQDGRAIEETLQSMARAVTRGDFQSWRELWHPRATELAPNRPAAAGLANILYGAKEWLEGWAHDMTVCCHEVQVAGRWAFASGELTLRSVSRSEERVDLLVGRFLAVLVEQEEGRWLMYRYCYTSSVPLAGDR